MRRPASHGAGWKDSRPRDMFSAAQGSTGGLSPGSSHSCFLSLLWSCFTWVGLGATLRSRRGLIPGINSGGTWGTISRPGNPAGLWSMQAKSPSSCITSPAPPLPPTISRAPDAVSSLASVGHQDPESRHTESHPGNGSREELRDESLQDSLPTAQQMVSFWKMCKNWCLD